MESTIVYWSYIGIMEKNMETTILGLCRDAAEKVQFLRVERLGVMV